MKKLIITILIFSLLLCCGCGSTGAEHSGSISIWYINGDILEDELNYAAEGYMAENPAVSIELRGFGGEGELSSALEGKRPDLLLCSHSLAFTLFEQGRLRGIKLGAACVEQQYIDEYPALSESFFPLGASADVLVYDKSVFDEESLSSLEAFIERTHSHCRQGGEPFTADSFAGIFISALLQLDCEMSPDRYKNCSEEDYVYLHNLLSEAAFSGSLAAFDEGAAGLMREGRLSAAVMPCYAAAEFADSYGVCPIPPAEGGERCCLAQLHGFAYVGNTYDNAALTGDFLSFVFSGEIAERVTARGLVPVLPQADGQEMLFSDWQLVFLSPVSGYSLGRQELEEQLRFAFRCLQ